MFRQCPVPPVFFALGERGKPAEAVADEAVEQALAFRAAGCPVDPHAADQIALPLAFAAGESAYRTGEVTLHLTTNLDIVARFTGRDVSCDGEVGSAGVVRVGGPAV